MLIINPILVVMKKLLIISLALTRLFLGSCSVSKKIDRTAEKGILNNSAFLPAFTGISVYEPATGKYLYDHLAEKYFVPASNTKLASCYAAMKYIGDSIPGIYYRIVNDSTVVIRPTGDPTFLHPDYKNQPVFDFLIQFRNIQIERPAFTRYLGNGWSWNDYKEYYMAQRSAMPIYGNVVTVNTNDQGTLSISPKFFTKSSSIKGNVQNGFHLNKTWDTNEFVFLPGQEKKAGIPFVPDNNTLLQLLKDTLKSTITFIDHAGELNQVIHSQPLDNMLKHMMYRSDNFYAEQSLLMASSKVFGYLDEKKMIDTLLKSNFQLLPQVPRWADGSGLSRYNNFSPRDFISILLQMKKEFGMERIKTILPTGGTGTISSYYLADSGSIFVKTGTLNGVVALSGFLYTKKNKLLVFSVLVNHHNSSATIIRKGIEEFVQGLRNNY
jgi:D-alanyl-D-alanine carboxypeptidase/D-alanyl-D-alanine-endopeptidase (penicillin-binding protein 4)